MSIYDLAMLLCLLSGVFGSFGMAHESRIRASAPFFYALSALYAVGFWSRIYGILDPSQYHWLWCLAGISLFVHASFIRHAWVGETPRDEKREQFPPV